MKLKIIILIFLYINITNIYSQTKNGDYIILKNEDTIFCEVLIIKRSIVRCHIKGEKKSYHASKVRRIKTNESIFDSGKAIYMAIGIPTWTFIEHIHGTDMNIYKISSYDRSVSSSNYNNLGGYSPNSKSLPVTVTFIRMEDAHFTKFKKMGIFNARKKLKRLGKDCPNFRDYIYEKGYWKFDLLDVVNYYNKNCSNKYQQH